MLSPDSLFQNTTESGTYIKQSGRNTHSPSLGSPTQETSARKKNLRSCWRVTK
jgi:hypothetical protein